MSNQSRVRKWLRSRYGSVSSGRRVLASHKRRRQAARWCGLEALEARLLLSTFAVTTAADTGAGSLREAIIQANTTANVGDDPDRIEFNFGSGGVPRISPLSALPTITESLIIDGFTQTEAAANTNPITMASNAEIRIELDGSALGAGANGLHITAGDSEVRGLAIGGFQGAAILLETGGNNIIAGNYIGTNFSPKFRELTAHYSA